MYAAVDLSKYIVNKCIADGHPISNLQLQKILYYIQKDFLERGQIAFFDTIEAWQFGPVVPNAYYHFCGFGAMKMTVKYAKAAEVSEEDAGFINPIVERRAVIPPWSLVEETHKDGGAWQLVYRDGQGNHQPIPLKLIREAG